MSKLDDFDPNTRSKSPVWGTYVPKRSGAGWKLHTSRGHALNAFEATQEGSLWENIGGFWIERCRKEPSMVPPVGQDDCRRCGKTTRPHGTKLGYVNGKLMLKRDLGGKIVEPFEVTWVHRYRSYCR